MRGQFAATLFARVAVLALVAIPAGGVAAAQGPQGSPDDANLAQAAEPLPPADQNAGDGPALPADAESLRDAIVASLKSNPDIQIALAKQDDAKFGVSQSRAGNLPHVDMQIGYGPEIVRQNGTTGDLNKRFEGTVTVNQNVWDFGTTSNDIKRSKASYRAMQWATREQIEAITFDITNAYLGILQQQKLIELGNEEMAATKKILRMITVQKELGLTTQADVDRAKARVENLQSSLLDRQSLLQQARDSYTRLTDRSPGRAVDLPPSGGALPATVDAAVEMISQHSPRMAQAVEDRRSLERQYASQKGTFFPRVGVQLQGNHRYDVLGRTGLVQDARGMVTLSYSFLNGGADVALRNRIGARLRQADYELERRRREVEQDLRADFQSLGAARQKMATISAEIESAERVADLYKQQFKESKRSVFDLLDSQQGLFNARGSYVANDIAMKLAEYRVLQKLGGLFTLVSDGEPLPRLTMPAPVVAGSGY
ncbi:TolC family protein [Sphingosinicella sp. BN140058]|uniref:TolC family protein n=1 Tax=Sphingosinicella sp. BN140058 TaxID=1892855 RepID=UPI0013EDAD5A|nr:TolC family protein [Sphingosinicella sp. BN140058]